MRHRTVSHFITGGDPIPACGCHREGNNLQRKIRTMANFPDPICILRIAPYALLTIPLEGYNIASRDHSIIKRMIPFHLETTVPLPMNVFW